MKIFMFTVHSREEKNKWLNDTPVPGPSGIPGKYIAENKGGKNTWRIYLVTPDE